MICLRDVEFLGEVLILLYLNNSGIANWCCESCTRPFDGTCCRTHSSMYELTWLEISLQQKLKSAL